MSSDAAWQPGQAMSPYSMIVTGAEASPRTFPFWGMPASSFSFAATPVMLETVLESPPAKLTATRTPTTTIAATIAPTMYRLFTPRPPPTHPGATDRRPPGAQDSAPLPVRRVRASLYSRSP